MAYGRKSTFPIGPAVIGTPTTGQVPTAASSTVVSWQSPSSGGTSVTDKGAWAASTVYAVGDMVTYGGCRFVRLGTGFTSGSTFDPSNWSALDALTIDNPAVFGAADAADYEFDATTASLPSGWAWVNQGTATYSESAGAGRIDYAGAGSADWKIVKRAVASGNWTATFKVAGTTPVGAAYTPAVILRESSSGKFIAVDHYLNGASSTSPWYAEKWTNPTTYGGSTFFGPIDLGDRANGAYIRIKKNSSTSYDFSVSFDGLAFIALATNINVTSFCTPDEIGFALNGQHSSAISVSCYFLRHGTPPT